MIIHGIYATDNIAKKLMEEYAYLASQIEIVSRGILKQVSAFKVAPEIMMVCDRPKAIDSIPLARHGFIVYLDSLQDPGNVGTIFRTAEWFGAKAVILSPDTVNSDNPKLIQSSMGAVFRQPFKVMHLKDLKQALPSYRILGTYMEGENIFELQVTGGSIIVIGNEGKGISESHLSIIDQKIKIPAAPNNKSESLNAAAAASIIIAQIATFAEN